jgi:multidrug efflux pump subunit AcrB
MWLVRTALRRPYTIAVASLLIILLGVLSISRMVVDIFPVINIPVVIVVWNYPGLSPEDMERRVVLISERAYSTTVNGISRIESESIPGIGILKVYFEPNTDIGAAIAQIASVSGTILRIVPPGMTPPNVIQFNASNVPVAQLTVSSNTIPEQKLYDYGLNFIRVRLFTIPGLSTPAPFGGKERQIIVDINPQALAAKGLSPADVVAALQSSNVILPAGQARIGRTNYNVLMNSSPEAVEGFKSIPIKVVGNAPVLLGEVAQVSDSYAMQQSIVHVNGKRATYLAILKHADASTLAVVDATRDALPSIKAVAPHGMEVKIDFDQSVFVRGAVKGVIREAILASILVSLMILMFLGSWRSVIVVCTSIPLAILTALIGLNLGNQTINIMTLGGLALAVGMLVDDATVAVESIDRHLEMGKPLTPAILDASNEIAVPAIVATLAICIVFFPVVLLSGAAKYLFTPMALAVVLAMLASYVLSRTLVATLSRQLFTAHRVVGGEYGNPGSGRFSFLNRWREKGFQKLQDAYVGLLEVVLHHRVYTLVVFGLLFLISGALPLMIGTDFFPSVDAGLMKLHFRAPTGTRLEDTERLLMRVEDRIRHIIPANELETINDFQGIPTSYNLAFVPTDNVGDMDAEVLIALKPKHHPTAQYMETIRRTLPSEFPGSSFYFQSADIVSQVLNFGVSAPIDVEVEGPDLNRSYQIARQLRDDIRQIPGSADVVIKQPLQYPALRINVDRQRAAQLGLTERDVANSMLISLSSSALVSPSYFLNPINNVNYTVAVRIPPSHFDSVQSLMNTPLSTPGSANFLQPAPPPEPQQPRPQFETLSNVARVQPQSVPEEVNHYTVQRVVDVTANLDRRDLGSVVRAIQKKIAALGALPPGMNIRIHGQYEVMNESFRSLLMGLVLAIILVYLLMVVLFQSWLDPFIIIMAVPGALMGILWMLALTGTTINVESLMGSIMAVGIATSNSILLVSYANDVRVERRLSPLQAALEAGRVRLRPVLMTALAMIIGMVPMALALGEAGEQNAPLGRAVIGGLVVATGTTLFVVPVIYSLLRRKVPSRHLLDERFLAEERGEMLPES